MLSSELRNKIIEFVEKKIEISELENWLVPNLPLLISSPDSLNSDVVSAIELGLAEVSSDLRTQEEFTQLLLDVLSEEAIKSNYPVNSVTKASSSISNNRYISSNSLAEIDNNIISTIINFQEMRVG